MIFPPSPPRHEQPGRNHSYSKGNGDGNCTLLENTAFACEIMIKELLIVLTLGLIPIVISVLVEYPL